MSRPFTDHHSQDNPVTGDSRIHSIGLRRQEWIFRSDKGQKGQRRLYLETLSKQQTNAPMEKRFYTLSGMRLIL